MSTASPPEPSGPPDQGNSDAAFLKRVERDAFVIAAVAIVLGGVLGGVEWAAGIAGGGALAGLSYWAIRGSVDAMLQVMGRQARPPSWTILVVVVGRHALLAVAGYVIIARLRLHPIGVLVGASAVVLAAIREAIRGRT